MTTIDAQAYRVQFEDRPTSTSPAPDLIAVFREALGRAHTATMMSPRPTTDEFIEWLESDSLDWDAVARVRADGW